MLELMTQCRRFENIYNYNTHNNNNDWLKVIKKKKTMKFKFGKI